ncbi:hypothetical protein [Planctomycetes bacterium Pan216]|uniref:hypothetical protein n=1 Tax=Kolteria novifilia TaxID=2527975 RepID=UPI0011A75E54
MISSDWWDEKSESSPVAADEDSEIREKVASLLSDLYSSEDGFVKSNGVGDRLVESLVDICGEDDAGDLGLSLLSAVRRMKTVEV